MLAASPACDEFSRNDQSLSQQSTEDSLPPSSRSQVRRSLHHEGGQGAPPVKLVVPAISSLLTSIRVEDRLDLNLVFRGFQ